MRSKIMSSLTSNKSLVIEGGTLVDGTGNPALENAVIVVDGERINSIGKKGELPLPKGTRIINAKGKTILPGFIDGHGHYEDFAGEIYLHLGVTTCPDIQTTRDDYWSMAQRDGIRMGKICGPRIWSAGKAVGQTSDTSAMAAAAGARFRSRALKRAARWCAGKRRWGSIRSKSESLLEARL